MEWELTPFPTPYPPRTLRPCTPRLKCRLHRTILRTSVKRMACVLAPAPYFPSPPKKSSQEKVCFCKNDLSFTLPRASVEK